MATEFATMPKPRSKKSDDDLPRPLVQIQSEFVPLVHLLARLRAHRVTQVVNDLVRLGLEQEGLWPITPEVEAELQKYGLG